MKWFHSKTKQEIRALKADVEALKRELKRRTEVRIGIEYYNYPFSGYQDDPRPSIKLIDLVNLLMVQIGLEVKQTPSVPSKIVIESKPKAKK